MKTICYYISDYGYGHATRSIALIRSLLKYAPNQYRIIVCSKNALPFIRESLKGEGSNNIIYREGTSDLGYVLKEGAIDTDPILFKSKYLDYMETLPFEIQKEADFIASEHASLVISDISPIPIAAARIAKVKSLGISNFTWYTAYKDMLSHKYLQPLFHAYSQMDNFISLAGSNEPHWCKGVMSMKADFFCRDTDENEVQRLINKLNPKRNKCIIYFALGMSIQASGLDSMKMWQDDSCAFVVSSNMNIAHENIHFIPSSYTESQNYVAAADVIITKPGWGTVGEAVSLYKPLLLLNRELMREDYNTIDSLKGRHPYQLKSWERLKVMNDKTTFARLVSSRIMKQNGNSDWHKRNVVKYIDQFIQQHKQIGTVERG